MGRLPRRLALWGGAAAIAGGGFAFMASNNVLASSAGEGAGAVSGYTVSNQTYTTQVKYTPGAGRTLTFVKSVTFTLTTKSTTPNATGAPKLSNMNVYAVNFSTTTPWGHQAGYCSTTGWAHDATGHGYGTFTCTFTPLPPVATVHKLDVSAAQ